METVLEIADADHLHIQFMKQSKSWGSGNPRTYLPSINNTFFDAHRCLSFDKRITITKAGYIEASCNDDIGRNVAVVEWSLSVNSALKNTDEFKIDGRETQQVPQLQGCPGSVL
ncbi:hypothetical protein BGZ61DRAFT_478576 [Ilyonectria robusta]|uniref:uncharacterized protein n=1 Tax=Ilyonectria robusta TaxID=1079257 RepID=UPI001E8E9CD5|nr:uncharacterized protein BGZ61DRAFT_478576 [Ilyonectria robusta]KAH8688243.1 hypothetical protein BGZ61DRAFT_478576 [Ilyonectria robusta]